ncbi:MAG TPA: hypothetical protein VGL35_12965 [Rhizomicrobium sp.]|jgi:hypothetical protein
MYKTALLATAAALLLTAAGAEAATPSVGAHGSTIVPGIHLAKGARMLYDQNSDSTGTGLASMNFTSSLTNEDSYGADDFVIPKRRTWTVREVDVSGVYYNGIGPANDENVVFYTDAKGKPGKAIKKGSFADLQCEDSAGSFSCSLGRKGLKLSSGRYWVSVYADMDFVSGAGQWGWYIRDPIRNDPAVWENPGDGYGTGCTTWGELGTCVGYSGDFMFDLQGKSERGR